MGECGPCDGLLPSVPHTATPTAPAEMQTAVKPESTDCGIPGRCNFKYLFSSMNCMHKPQAYNLGQALPRRLHNTQAYKFRTSTAPQTQANTTSRPRFIVRLSLTKCTRNGLNMCTQQASRQHAELIDDKTVILIINSDNDLRRPGCIIPVDGSTADLACCTSCCKV